MPGRRRGPPAEQRGGGGFLHRIKHFRLRGFDAVGEILQERLLGQFGEAIENSPVLITLTSGNDNYCTKCSGNFRQMIVSTG